MSDFLFDRPLDCLASEAADARLVRCVRPAGLRTLLGDLPPHQAAWLADRGFAARQGELVLLPDATGIGGAVLGLGETGTPVAFGGLSRALLRKRSPAALSTDPSPDSMGARAEGAPDNQSEGAPDNQSEGAPDNQSEGAPDNQSDGAPDKQSAGSPDDRAANLWRLALPDDADPNQAVLGFCQGAYRFTAFRPVADLPPCLVAPPGSALGQAIARSVWLARDLINMPANRLGPLELAEAGRDVAVRFGARVSIVSGDALADRYPAIAAVGAGSARPPRVLVADWRGSRAADTAPLLSLVGKGVVFDTGGYDLKPSAGMLRMKKDMGGAALMLALARLVMSQDLPVRLSLRLGCVENSVSGHAMRPSDVLATRRGLSVEVGNTDAEGRLVLCDLLAEASDLSPDLLIDAATLTGAARTALGPDLPALFCNDDHAASCLLSAGIESHDPLWRLPLWPGYDDWLSSTVADLNNVSSRPMAGAITAALFLQRFVAKSIRWAHVDSYSWNDRTSPGRPEGGEALGLRALFQGSLQILNLGGDTKQSGNVIGTEPNQMNAL